MGDQATRRAATGALAMLSEFEEIAPHIASNEKFSCLLELLQDTADPDIQHRVAACLGNICGMSGAPADARSKSRAALREKRATGFASKQAEDLARSAIEGGGVSAGGA